MKTFLQKLDHSIAIWLGMPKFTSFQMFCYFLMGLGLNSKTHFFIIGFILLMISFFLVIDNSNK